MEKRVCTTEKALHGELRFDLIPLKTVWDIIGDNFRDPDHLTEIGFRPEGFQDRWKKTVTVGEIDKVEAEVTIYYCPGRNRRVQTPGIKGEAGRTVTDWYAIVDDPDNKLTHSTMNQELNDILSGLFQSIPRLPSF